MNTQIERPEMKYQVEYTVWVNTEGENLHDAVSRATDCLSEGKYDFAVIVKATDENGNEVIRFE